MRAALALLVFLAASGVAHAVDLPDRACAKTHEPRINEGPIVLGLFDADFGTARRACLRSELALYERFSAVIDAKDFYGGVRADTIVSGSYWLRPRLELFGALELVHWEFAQNATVKASAIGLGQLTIGAQGLALETKRWVLSPYGRVLLPTASWTPSVQTIGAEIGVNASFRPHRKVELHGHLGADLTAGLSAGPAEVRGGTTLMVGVQYTPARWFALAVDLSAVLGHRAALDALLPSLALRFRAWRGLGIELDLTAPVAGADRRLAIAALRISYRF